MRRLSIVAVVVVLVSLAGCGSTATVAPPVGAAAAPITEVTASPVDTEGSVTTEEGSFVSYPDGLRVSIKSVNQELASKTFDSSQISPGDVVIRIVVHLANTGTAPISLSSEGFCCPASHELTYGQSRESAHAWATATDLPERLMPGTSVDALAGEFTLPKTDVLRFKVNPDDTKYTDYTFTDVETLL